jgi:Raf kinase inhibitor-like YbhB/YbcL family protein
VRHRRARGSTEPATAHSLTLVHRALLIVVVAIGVVAVSAPATAARPKLKLTSPAFKAGGTIPVGFTCEGQNASPPLRWKGVTKKTVELALTMEDPDTARGTFVHWVAWAIDPKAGELPEQNLPSTVKQGSNGVGQAKYLGPCPSTGNHHYIFTLYALSKPVTIAPGANIDELRAAIKETVQAKATLVGRYELGAGTAGAA